MSKARMQRPSAPGIAAVLALASLAACDAGKTPDRGAASGSTSDGVTVAILGDGGTAPVGSTMTADAGDAGAATYTGHRLEWTRLLRRVSVALTGVPPTVAQYQAILAAPDDDTRQGMVNASVDTLLQSTAFYDVLVRFGHDYFNAGSHASSEGYWIYNQAATLHKCAAGTTHAGLFGSFSDIGLAAGDPTSMCSDPNAVLTWVEPWWAPGTMIQVVGRAGSGVRAHDGIDCGQTQATIYGEFMADTDNDNAICSCGPNLVYCMPNTWDDLSNNDGSDLGYNASLYNESSQAKQLFDESARLLAHVVWQDRPFSDLVLGNYTVAPLNLKYYYVRSARMSGTNSALDDVKWFEPSSWTGPVDPEHKAGDPLAWQEVVVQTIEPNLLALSPGNAVSGDISRTATYDPTQTTAQPAGVGAAGVMTQLGAMQSFARERVRAARWLTTFACRDFTPPPDTETFNTFTGDPATGGICQHCHTTIDPAAIHFKRFGENGNTIGGIGNWEWSKLLGYGDDKLRWETAFLPGTILTPITAAQIAANPDAVFYDFLPPTQKLFNQASDGTPGPLGFGKLLVSSGEFDNCAVQKLYARFAGYTLDPATEQPKIDQLSALFVKNGRMVRPFIKAIMSDADVMGRGW